jgi:hypothetical protein
MTLHREPNDAAEQTPGAERARLDSGDRRTPGPWKHWGPYISERAWGTVREDYSEDGAAWEAFPHDQARSRAYRWNEDGLAGICDINQRLCFAFSFWNHQDPILKERLFGLNGNEGNHGEDVKEYWWNVDSTPTHSWMRWRYYYPQREFPYADLVAENARRGRDDPEYELHDTGVFEENRFWAISVDYAKESPEDICVAVEIRNCGPEVAPIDVIPTLWFRNSWSWGLDARRPKLSEVDGGINAEHWELGVQRLEFADGPDGPPELMFCDNETNFQRVFHVDGGSDYPKDGINDHVVSGAATLNPMRIGTKAGARYSLQVPAGESVQLRFRLGKPTTKSHSALAHSFGHAFDAVMSTRQQEADEFYKEVIGDHIAEDETLVARRAIAGMLWSKQFYHFNVDRWLDGDPAGPPPPETRRIGRNSHWRHLNNFDVLSMPDTWEYPWYAAWDLAFHAVTLARVDPDFAKHQLTLLCREWYMHPNGQLPAYEWAFDDVNPPVHAWAGLRVFEIDGHQDFEFLESLFHKLLLNFTWWVNRKDSEGNNLFEGGFLGLDNIGPFDRSNGLPSGGRLEQSDGTAWMAMYCLNMLDIALVLADHDDTYEDVATKFFEHFAYIATAMNDKGLWDDDAGFYRDLFRCESGETIPIPAISMVGLVPIFAVTTLDGQTLAHHPDFARRVRWFVKNKTGYLPVLGSLSKSDVDAERLLSIVDPERLPVILRTVLDERHLLSPNGLRSLSKDHREHPVEVTIAGQVHRLDYEPSESRSGHFGGNSNWRGPVWFPLNFLAIQSLRRFHKHLGNDFTIEYPTGSGNLSTLDQIADDLASRLVGLFRPDANGDRPSFATPSAFKADPNWRDLVLFHEYFDGDDGRGLGASHQTGWTGLVADLILERRRVGVLPQNEETRSQ